MYLYTGYVGTKPRRTDISPGKELVVASVETAAYGGAEDTIA